MKLFISFILFVFYMATFQVNAQIDTSSIKKDSIIVNKDPRLDILTQKQSLINKRSQLMTSTGLWKGYRLQLLSTNIRTQAFKLKYDLLVSYPTHKVYISYQAPYFKVRFGNFIKKEDAELIRKELSKKYAAGIFIVQDAIEYTPKGDDDLMLK